MTAYAGRPDFQSQGAGTLALDCPAHGFHIQLCDYRGDVDTGAGIAAGRWIQISQLGRTATSCAPGSSSSPTGIRWVVTVGGATADKGFTLVEVLVALVVMSVGMLGIAALYLEGLRAGRTALYRTTAVNLAADMADRIRANQQRRRRVCRHRPGRRQRLRQRAR